MHSAIGKMNGNVEVRQVSVTQFVKKNVVGLEVS